MSETLNVPAADLEYILSTQAIRERSRQILKLADTGQTHFSVDRTKFELLADFVAEVTQANYPDLKVPFHSRWKHFNVGKIDRLSIFKSRLSNLSPIDQLRAKTELVIVSVLVDAGAGMKWAYRDPWHDFSCGKSEGLAVASFYAFMSGAFSSDPKNPLQVDAAGLAKLSWEKFQKDFQISAANPMEGDRGRFDLLKSLGKILATQEKTFGKEHRLGNLALLWTAAAGTQKKLAATAVLRSLQDALGSIWPGRVEINGYNVGDVWPCPALGEGFKALVPFHKLSQWLSYSLLDPIAEAGIQVEKITDLTGLAEYRNGGLLIDMGVIVPRDSENLKKTFPAMDPFVVEWRALTLAVIDEWAPLLRKKLGVKEDVLPLGKVLEGGTWWAGRKIALQMRSDGGSPIKIQSDGTVF